MTAGLAIDAVLVALMFAVMRHGQRERAHARRRDVFYGNNRGHDHEVPRA